MDSIVKTAVTSVCCLCAAVVWSSSLPGNRVVPMHFGPLYLPGLHWGCKGFLYGFGLDCVHLPGSCTAKLYGQVSCDYTCSQSQRMVLNDSGKVTFDERCISTTKPLHSLLQLSGICQEYVLNAFIT